MYNVLVILRDEEQNYLLESACTNRGQKCKELKSVVPLGV